MSIDMSNTLRISDLSPTGGFLAFDLCDILRLLGDAALKSYWKLAGVECSGGRAADAEAASREGIRVTGANLIAIASTLTQTIDGVFEGWLGTASKPWVVIRAIDSSYFEVESDDATLQTLAKHFKETELV